METGAWIAIAVAVLGAAAGIWAQVVQFNKDAQRIEGVNKTAGEIKADTNVMRPQVNNINTNVQEMRDKLLKYDYRLDSTMDGICELVNAKRSEEEISKRISSTIDNPAYIQNAVKLIYEKNADLEYTVSGLQNEKHRMIAKIQLLEYENQNLKQENQQLKKEIKEITRQMHQDKGISR